MFAITPDSFEDLFGSREATAKYSYDVSRSTNDGVFHASLSATIRVDNNDYHFNAEGDIDLLKFTDGSSVLSGPLYGSVLISGITFPFTAGFTKAVGSNKVNVGIVINPSIESSAQIMFAFGERVVDDSATPASAVDTSYSLHEYLGKESATPLDISAVFTKKGSTTKKLSNVSSVNGQTLSVYYASNANRVGVQVKTYVSAIKLYYDQQNAVISKVNVSKIVISLSRNSASEISSIKGIDSLTTPYVGNGYQYLRSLIINFLDLFGLPTGGLSSALSSLRGSLSCSVTGSKATITCKYGADSSTSSLDSAGMTVGFNLDPSTVSHSANYTVSSHVQYNVSYNIPLSGATSFYVSANSANLSYSLWLT